MPQLSDEYREFVIAVMIILASSRLSERFTLQGDVSDFTSGQHFFQNFEFCAEILGWTNSSMHWLLFGQFLKKVFGARAHAACLYKVNQFSEWIQAFWSLLRRNAAFSQSTNIHHFLQISTSFEKSVETWVLWICPIFVDFFGIVMFKHIWIFTNFWRN